jgi:hypothetical protein
VLLLVGHDGKYGRNQLAIKDRIERESEGSKHVVFKYSRAVDRVVICSDSDLGNAEVLRFISHFGDDAATYRLDYVEAHIDALPSRASGGGVRRSSGASGNGSARASAGGGRGGRKPELPGYSPSPRSGGAAAMQAAPPSMLRHNNSGQGRGSGGGGGGGGAYGSPSIAPPFGGSAYRSPAQPSHLGGGSYGARGGAGSRRPGDRSGSGATMPVPDTTVQPAFDRNQFERMACMTFVQHNQVCGQCKRELVAVEVVVSHDYQCTVGYGVRGTRAGLNSTAPCCGNISTRTVLMWVVNNMGPWHDFGE